MIPSRRPYPAHTILFGPILWYSMRLDSAQRINYESGRSASIEGRTRAIDLLKGSEYVAVVDLYECNAIGLCQQSERLQIHGLFR